MLFLALVMRLSWENRLSNKSLSPLPCMHAQLLGHVRLSATPQTVALQTLQSLGFSQKNTGVDWHFLFQRIFPIQGSNLCPLCSLALAGRFFTTEPPGNPLTPLTYLKTLGFWLQKQKFLESLLEFMNFGDWHWDLQCQHYYMRNKPNKSMYFWSLYLGYSSFLFIQLSVIIFHNISSILKVFISHRSCPVFPLKVWKVISD